MTQTEDQTDTGATGTAPATFDSLNPATGDVVGTHPVHTEAEVRAAVDAGPRGGRLVVGAVLRRARGAADLVEGRDDPPGRPARRPDAPGDGQAARRRAARGRAGHRPPGLGGRPRREGAPAAPGLLRDDHGQPGRDGGVPPARGGRRDRPVELPGLHADGLDRLRAGRRQRGGLQAQRVQPRHRRVAGPHLPAGRRPPGAPGGHRPRRDRRGAVPLRASTRSPSPGPPPPASG